MAKKRIINRGYRPIRNANLIGKGGKHIRPVKGSWVKGYNKAMAKPKAKTTPVKSSLKSRTGYVPKKSHSYSRKIRTTKASPSIKRVNRSLNRVAKRPSPKITMTSRKPTRKPPTRGR